MRLQIRKRRQLSQKFYNFDGTPFRAVLLRISSRSKVNAGGRSKNYDFQFFLSITNPRKKSIFTMKSNSKFFQKHKSASGVNIIYISSLLIPSSHHPNFESPRRIREYICFSEPGGNRKGMTSAAFSKFINFSIPSAREFDSPRSLYMF